MTNISYPKLEPLKILEGQVALITGGSSGIGEGVVKEFARSGAAVAVNYSHKADAAEKIAADIVSGGGKAIAVQADVSKEADVEAMFQKVIEEFGTVDILVNNAGLQKDAAFEEMTLDEWNTVIGVNLTGQFLCARAAVREFKKRGIRPEVSCSAGKIIHMSSVHEVIPWAGHANYAASKGGIHMLMQTIAQELAGDKIRVNAIGPGAIKTPINRVAWESDEAYTKLMELVPYGRIGVPEDIARTAVFLASDYSDYINGTTLFVDGGMTLYPGFRTGG